MTTITEALKLGGPETSIAAAFDRRDIARLLRTARQAEGDARAEAIDWAFAARPESRQVRRLKIESLIEHGDLEHANAMIARGLLVHPDDPNLSLLRTRVLLARRRIREADMEIQHALRARRHHVGTLRLAATVARAVDDLPRAVSLLEQALALRPECDDVKSDLMRTLLAAERIDRASRVLQSMREPRAELRARVLRAQGRRLEAVQLLESALEAPQAPPERTGNAILLIDLLEEIGAMAQLRRVMDEYASIDPAVLIRAGEAWLALGLFRTAIIRIAPLRRSRHLAGRALGIMLVAAAMLDRRPFAERVLTRLKRCASAPDAARLAELWRRALSARILTEQTSPRTAGTDRSTGLLAPLLRSALAVFDPIRRVEDPGPAGLTFADVARRRTLCLSALGLPAESGFSGDPMRIETPAGSESAPRSRTGRAA